MHNATDSVQMCHIHLEIMVGGLIDYNQGGNISLDLLLTKARIAPLHRVALEAKQGTGQPG